jgi:hypothetical protein
LFRNDNILRVIIPFLCYYKPNFTFFYAFHIDKAAIIHTIYVRYSELARGGMPRSGELIEKATFRKIRKVQGVGRDLEKRGGWG